MLESWGRPFSRMVTTTPCRRAVTNESASVRSMDPTVTAQAAVLTSAACRFGLSAAEHHVDHGGHDAPTRGATMKSQTWLEGDVRRQ